MVCLSYWNNLVGETKGKIMLTKDQARCAGRYDFHTAEKCPDRKTCLRYLYWRHLDMENGIEHYRDIPVVMATRNCELKIEKDAQ